MLPIQRRFKRAAARSRGFTLVELVLVVILVGMIAAISAPTVNQLIGHERESQKVRRISELISHARALAMGRGGSVLVRYPDGDGNIEVREAVAGLPAGSCGNAVAEVGCAVPGRWDSDARSRFVDLFNVTDLPSGMVIEGPNGAVSSLSLCFSAQGRTWAGVGTDVLTPLTSDISFTSTNDLGIEHRVVVLPTGATRHVTRNTSP